MFVVVLIEIWPVSLAWGQVNRLGVRGGHVCYLVIAFIFIRLGGTNRQGGLKSSYGGKRASNKGLGDNTMGGVEPSASLSELPTNISPF